MNHNAKQLSSPFSTGGGGHQFEAHVQASFVVLMLTGGFIPCIPELLINKIQFQGKFAGYNTDDLIVFAGKLDNTQNGKLLCQIKHSISITENDKVFGEVIQAAWNDFNNADLFSKGRDAIALITGPLSATDINDTRTILEWARSSESSIELINKVNLTNFSSSKKQQKLNAFKTNLSKANGEDVSDEILFEFLKHFHLLGYDLDIKAGVTLSLLHSLIGQYSQENALSLWTRIVDEVQFANKNAGVISFESLPEELRVAFTKKAFITIPAELSVSQLTLIKPDWNQLPYASDLAIANLLGSWNEKNKADLEIIYQLAGEEFNTWISRIREILQYPESPLSLRNGIWYVDDRKAFWKALSSRLFDSSLDSFKQSAIAVLTERDPKFDLPTGERYIASVHGKVLKYSPELRKGVSESLALLGSQSDELINCSQYKPETTATLTTREIFSKADWVLWGSLNGLLPVLAEASPDEFVNAVEKALQQEPCPFDELFSQMGDAILGENYLTGLLWALEKLAWDEKFLVRVCVLLAELASHDTGKGNWGNRPANSLMTILLPWFPQTIASIDKRKVALKTLQKETPAAAWRLFLSLLPNQHQVSSGTAKPLWRNTIPDNWKDGVSGKEYWEQISFSVDLVVEMARDDMDRLNELIKYFDKLPQASFDKIIEVLSSEKIYSAPDDERITLWNSLMGFISKHKRFSEAKWALSSETVLKVEGVAEKLAPTNPLSRYRRLFINSDLDLYEENEKWEEQQRKLGERRKLAITEIQTYDGLKGILQFAQVVESPARVGNIFGSIAELDIDGAILPKLLETDDKKLAQFVSGYIWGRLYANDWAWVDELHKSDWSIAQMSRFLVCLPFTNEAWKRASAWLGSAEEGYWARVNVNPYHSQDDLVVAIDKLLEYGRPNAAIDCIYKMYLDKQALDPGRSVTALLAAVSSKEPSYAIDTHQVIEIIKALQETTNTNPDDLFQVEWAYLPILDGFDGASPKLLENRLASAPAFFCEAIQLVYRSNKVPKFEGDIGEREKSIATNAWRLLHEWKTPPGLQPDGIFLVENFNDWLKKIKEVCIESGHLDIALTHVGQVLIYCPPDPQGLWINLAVADALNAKDASKMRNGFNSGIFNSRGVHWVDPTGKPERELAEQYKQKAEDVENAGYQRLAVTLRDLADEYNREADRIIDEHKHDTDDKNEDKND